MLNHRLHNKGMIVCIMMGFPILGILNTTIKHINKDFLYVYTILRAVMNILCAYHMIMHIITQTNMHSLCMRV